MYPGKQGAVKTLDTGGCIQTPFMIFKKGGRGVTPNVKRCTGIAAVGIFAAKFEV